MEDKEIKSNMVSSSGGSVTYATFQQVEDLEKATEKLQELLRDNEKKVDKVNNNLMYVVLILFASFLIGYSALVVDNIKEKDLYLQYNIMQTKYSQRVSDLERVVNKQLLEGNNLKHELELLKIKEAQNNWLEKILYKIKQHKTSTSTTSI